jgi:hypothetical protein
MVGPGACAGGGGVQRMEDENFEIEVLEVPKPVNGIVQM